MEHDNEYKPISMWGYFGYELLFAIPIIGFIIALVLAFAAGNKNVKNFARSQFCMLILVCIIIAIIVGYIYANIGDFRYLF